MRLNYVIYSVANAADCILTIAGVSAGWSEANPIVNAAIQALGPVPGIALCAGLAQLLVFIACRRFPTLPIVPAAIHILMAILWAMRLYCQAIIPGLLRPRNAVPGSGSPGRKQGSAQAPAGPRSSGPPRAVPRDPTRVPPSWLTPLGPAPFPETAYGRHPVKSGPSPAHAGMG